MPTLTALEERITEAKAQALNNAIKALAQYKFWMFGYWASKWISLNQIDEYQEPNPFKDMVTWAKGKLK